MRADLALLRLPKSAAWFCMLQNLEFIVRVRIGTPVILLTPFVATLVIIAASYVAPARVSVSSAINNSLGLACRPLSSLGGRRNPLEDPPGSDHTSDNAARRRTRSDRDDDVLRAGIINCAPDVSEEKISNCT